MDLLTFSLAIAATAGIYYHYKKKLSYFKDRGVPYEPGLPLFGNMASIIFRIKDIFQMVHEIYEANPDAKYVGAYNFGQPAILIRDPGLIKMITIKNFDHFQNHSLTCNKEVDPMIGSNLFNIKGERWREARNLLRPTFTSGKLKSMFKFIVKSSENLNNYISKLSNEERQNVATKDLFLKYMTDVIANCAFGITVNSLQNPNNNFYILGKKGAVFEGYIIFKFYIACLFPRLAKFFKIRVIDETVVTFFKNTILDVIETRDKNEISRPDVIQLLMDTRSIDKKFVKLDIDEVISHAFLFFAGGFDTTSTQMRIIAHELAMNPDVQEKLQNEVDKVRKKTNGELLYEDIQNMAYLDAVFNESLRRHTEVIILDRVCEKSLELPPALPGGKPFVIEPGTMVWISGKCIHMDSKYYDNPEKFDPERYYKKKISINDEFNLGFGIGPRACIGLRFAKLTTKILFFYLLSEFNLVSNERMKSAVTNCKNLTNIKSKVGFYVAIEGRSSREK